MYCTFLHTKYSKPFIAMAVVVSTSSMNSTNANIPSPLGGEKMDFTGSTTSGYRSTKAGKAWKRRVKASRNMASSAWTPNIKIHQAHTLAVSLSLTARPETQPIQTQSLSTKAARNTCLFSGRPFIAEPKSPRALTRCCLYWWRWCC